MNESLYPEDRGEIYGEVNEEEAWLYHTLSEFEDIVNKYGAQFVLARMRNSCFEKLSEWFYDAGANSNQELAWLLKKKDVSIL